MIRSRKHKPIYDYKKHEPDELMLHVTFPRDLIAACTNSLGYKCNEVLLTVRTVTCGFITIELSLCVVEVANKRRYNVSLHKATSTDFNLGDPWRKMLDKIFVGLCCYIHPKEIIQLNTTPLPIKPLKRTLPEFRFNIYLDHIMERHSLYDIDKMMEKFEKIPKANSYFYSDDRDEIRKLITYALASLNYKDVTGHVEDTFPLIVEFDNFIGEKVGGPKCNAIKLHCHWEKKIKKKQKTHKNSQFKYKTNKYLVVETAYPFFVETL